MTLSEHVKSAIESAVSGGLTEYAVAKKVGVSQIHLSRFRKGERDVSLTVASRICNGLGIDFPSPKKLSRKSVLSS